MDQISFQIGALTSKPYAFNARPWELVTVYSMDFTESLGTTVRYDVRDNMILRILPAAGSMGVQRLVWLTDKGRFIYDSYRRQRLLCPQLQLQKGLFNEISWPTVERFLRITKMFRPIGTIGDNTNVQENWMLANFFYLSGTKFLTSTTPNFCFFDHYLSVGDPMTLSPELLEKANYFFLINDRISGIPVGILPKLFQLAEKKKIAIYLLGKSIDLLENKRIQSLGSNIGEFFKKLSRDSSQISKIFSKKNGVWFFSQSITSNKFDTNGLLEMVKPFLSKKKNLIKTIYVSGNIKFPTNSFFGNPDMPIFVEKIPHSPFNKKFLCILRDNEKSSDEIHSGLTIFQGIHGNVSKNSIDLFLPEYSNLEKGNQIFFNTFKRLVFLGETVIRPHSCARLGSKYIDYVHFVRFYSKKLNKVLNLFPKKILGFVQFKEKKIKLDISLDQFYFIRKKSAGMTTMAQKIVNGPSSHETLHMYVEDSMGQNSLTLNLSEEKFKFQNFRNGL